MVLKNVIVYIVVKICNLVKYIGTWKTPVFLSIHITLYLSAFPKIPLILLVVKRARVFPHQAIFRHQRGVLYLSSVLTLPSWPFCCSHMSIISPGCHLFFWPLAVNWRFPQMLPWGPLVCWSSSQNSTKQLLTRLSVYCKRISLRNSRWKSCIEQGMWEGMQSFQDLCVSLSQHFLVFSLHPILAGFYGGSITQAWLIKSLAIVDWSQCLSPPQMSGVGGV